ncbi:MAG: hypothetical protein ABJ242_09950 [Marinomonas sp.]
MLKLVRLAGFLLIGGIATPALAEPETVEIAEDADWSHQWTAMRFPAHWGDFQREQIIQFQERESDISARYLDAAGDVLSIYIYRPGLANAPIWHDRALVGMGANDVMFGSDGVQGKRSATFAPNGSKVESGLLTVLTSNGDFRSTGLAIYQAGEWLVKVRLSSRRLDPEGLEELLRKVLRTMPKLENYGKDAAYLIEPCLDEVQYTNAERFKPDPDAGPSDALGSAMMTLLGGDVLAEAETGKSAQPYCREGNGGSQGSVYRRPGEQESYIIAFGDSGTSAQAGPALSLDTILSEEDPDAPQRAHFTVTYSTATHRRTFMPFVSLPQPNQAGRAVFREEPVVTYKRPLGDEGPEIEIGTSVLGKSDKP